MNRYLALLAVGLVAAIAVGRVAVRPRAEDRPASAPAPVTTVVLVLAPGGVEPPMAAVPKGSRLHVAIENRSGRPATVSLAGYQDVMPAFPIPAGGRYEYEFPADRPGDDFTWLVNGEPMGRVRVTGSHLIEGHR